MAAPTKVKTWTKDFIQVNDGEGPEAQPGAATYDTEVRQVIFEIKEALIGTNGNWTVAMSCGYAAGVWSSGAADYWLVANDVRFLEAPDSKFTWVVLQNNAIKTGFQIMFVLDNEDSLTDYWNGFYVSHSGSFTGGSSTARPTASDEYHITSSGWFYNPSDITRTVNILMSTDGECTRIVVSTDGVLRVIALIEKPIASTGLGTDIFEGVGLTGVIDIYASQRIGTEESVRKLVAAQGEACGWGGYTEGVGGTRSSSTQLIQGVNYSGERYATPIFAMLHSGGSRGILGEIVDMYNVDEDLTDGDFAPAGGTKAWVVLSEYLFANDGTLFLL